LIAGKLNLPVLDVAKNVFVKNLLPGFSEKVNTILASGGPGHECVAVAYNFDSFPSNKIATVEVIALNSGKSIAHLEFKGMLKGGIQHVISLDGACLTMLIAGLNQATLVAIPTGQILDTFSELLSDSNQDAGAHQLSAGALPKDGKMVAIAYRKIMIFKKASR
jgi:hypothetical protein